MRRSWIAAVALAALAATVPAWAQCEPNDADTQNIIANITTSTTWTANKEWILTQPIYVTNGATLTIEPGTVIRGEPEATLNSNDPGTLIITRDAKLVANGTAEQPIVFTDCTDDNVGGNPGTEPYDHLTNALGIVENWGGVILLGRSYVANNTAAGPNAAREFQIEGLTAVGGLGFYGNGGEDDDDSGSLRYVSIRYGGFNLSANNEINGLTMGAVGRQTDIDYVEVIQSKDDCFEWFGGTVGAKHLICAANGDDGLDYDEGFRGRVQFAFLMQSTPGTDKSDKGGEHDGGNSPDASLPLTIPTFYNVTYIGHGGNGGAGADDPVKAYTDKAKNTALHFRDNAGGRYYNSFFGSFGGSTLMIEGDPGVASTSGQRAATAYSGVYDGHCSVSTGTQCIQDADCPGGETCVGFYRDLYSSSNFQLELQDNVFWCFGGGSAVPDTAPAAVAAGGDNLDHWDNGAFTNGALDNQYLDCATALPIGALERVGVGGSVPDPIVRIDPTPAAGSPLLTTDRRPPADGFFDGALYVGAFGPGDNWAAGWSTMARLGYFEPSEVVLVTANITTSTTWTADNIYELDKPIYVTNGATLTIEPGTIVRGQPEATLGSNDPGTVIITRDSKIDACGTPDAPIVFTDLVDDNVGASSGSAPYDTLENAIGVVENWGGVILLGRTYVANNTAGGPNPAREFQIEGLTAVGGLGFYGNGGDDDDDSGRLCYANIRYGGFNLSANNEINGLTMGAVGRETEIHHVEVIQSKDDCFEWFGGTVGSKYLVCANNGDDGLDYDEGFRGKVQFAFVMQGLPGTDKSDKAGEHDGGNSPDGSLPFTIPTFYNVSYVGHGGNGGVGADGVTVVDPVKAYTDKAKNTTLHFRDNAGGRYYNSFFASFGGSAALIEGDPATANTSGQRARQAYGLIYDGECSVSGNPCYSNADCPSGEVCQGFYQGEVSQYQLELEHSSFWCLGGSNQVPDTMAAGVAAGGDSLEHYNNGLFNVCSNNPNQPCNLNADCGAGNSCIPNAALGNSYFACSTALPIRTLERFDIGAGLPNQIIAIDPRPNPAPGGGADLDGSATRPTPADGFFSPAPYRGAFGSNNWADGWTTMSRLGWFPRCDGGTNPLAVPNEARNLHWTSKEHFGWDAPLGDDAQYYDTLRSLDKTDFTSADCVETEDDDRVTFDAEEPLNDSDCFFYLVLPKNDCGAGPLHLDSAGVEVSAYATCP